MRVCACFSGTYRLAAASPLSGVAMPMSLYLTPLILTVSPRASFFSLAYDVSATATLASVSDVLNVRPLVTLEEVRGPRPCLATSVPYTL